MSMPHKESRRLTQRLRNRGPARRVWGGESKRSADKKDCFLKESSGP